MTNNTLLALIESIVSFEKQIDQMKNLIQEMTVQREGMLQEFSNEIHKRDSQINGLRDQYITVNGQCFLVKMIQGVLTPFPFESIELIELEEVGHDQ